MEHSILFQQCENDHMTCGRSHIIDRIAIHSAATLASACNNVIYFSRNERQGSSAHYFVDIALIAVGLIIAVAGDHLTTYERLGNSDGYSYIREYVGGDAYNYIMGASLVACMGLLAFAHDQPKPAAHFAAAPADTATSPEQLE